MSDLQTTQVKANFRRAYHQLKNGCGRAVCFNRDCRQFPFRRNQTLPELLQELIERFKTGKEDVTWCQEAWRREGGEESSVTGLFERVEELGAAFVEMEDAEGRPIVTEDDPGIHYSEVRGLYERCRQLVESGRLDTQWLFSALRKVHVTEFSYRFLPRALLILLENPDLFLPEQFDAFELLIAFVLQLQNDANLQFQRWLSNYPGEHFVQFVYIFQQYITVKLLEAHNRYFPQNVIDAIRALNVLHEANQLRGKVSYKEFYNDAVNKETEMKDHYVNWKRAGQSAQRPLFSVLFYPWILDSATKAMLFEVETGYQQRTSMQESILREALMTREGFLSFSPYLVLRIRREFLIRDTITSLQLDENSLKKPLKVHFEGEEGVDGGGLQKEFFQLIVRELFDPAYSMFSYYEDTRLYWFNPDTVASRQDFELIGMILGLAIYNNNILDVHLPIAVYKKLMGRKATIEDLEVFNPALAKGLQAVLLMDGDVESTLCRTFVVETATFETVAHELKPGGSSTPVTNANREEYVNLYVDWVLDAGISESFSAFQQGFLKVCGGDFLSMFLPEELELLITGNPTLDFYALESACVYEDGYTRDSLTCRLLWKVLHTLTESQKKKFLFFVTGSDRAPINGLGAMRLVISRNGPDSDRLMTAHTCFNHLLLPEYKAEEKIKDMLLLAINNSEGFGLR